MSSRSVVQFIADERASGKTDSEITHMLLDAGWHMDIIHKAMNTDPIRHRNLDPILEIKKQPYRKPIIIVTVLLIIIAVFGAVIYF